ncbi:hypothetical protein JHK86_047714 [Glycine max]|nr:hypothetical protein JHK86_047714 [Glycine max]
MSGNLKQHFANEMDIISSTKRWIRVTCLTLTLALGLTLVVGLSVAVTTSSFARIQHDAAKLRTSKDLEADIPCAASTLLQYYRAIGYPAVVASCVVRVRNRGYRAIV